MNNAQANQADIQREHRANLYAFNAMGLSPRDVTLSGKHAKRFRALFTEEYMRHPVPREVEVACACSHLPYTHHHSPEERARARRTFESQSRSGRIR